MINISLLLFLFLFAIRSEYTDLTRRSAIDTDNTLQKKNTKNEVGLGYGASYYNGIPRKGDSFSTLIKKVIEAASYESKSVKWRKCIIIGFTLSLILLTVVNKLKIKYLVYSTLIIFTFMYVFFQVYEEVQVYYAINHVKRGLSLLRKLFVFR
jgi:hypothetical protein